YSLRVRKGEGEPALLLTLQLMLAMASLACLKATSDSLFLSRFDATRLPLVDLAITVLVGAVVGVYLRLSNRVSLGWLIGSSQVFLALNLLAFWMLMRWHVPFVPALIYVWVGTFAVLIPSQVWTLAGTVFDTRQAKRLFSLIGGGGIIGAAIGGQCASILGPLLGTENLLLVTMVFVLCGTAMACRVTSAGGRPGEDSRTQHDGTASFTQTLKEVRGSAYLSFIAAALFFSTLASTLVKYQFKAVAKANFESSPAELVAFFGDFLAYIAVVSFLFHILLSGRLLRRLGVGATIFILPISLFLGSGALLFSTALGAAILARGADQAFRHSVDRASVELLYVPLAENLRRQVKSFFDMAVSRTADGFASLILLVLLSGLGFGITEVSWVAIAVVAIWLGVNWRLRGSYVSTLRASIERKDISPEQLLRSLAQSSPTSQIEGTLQSGDPRAVETAVDWMQFSGVGAEQAHLAWLLTHESSTIRRKTMAVIAAHGLPDYEDDVLRFLQLEQEVGARWQALEYLDSRDRKSSEERLSELLMSKDRSLAASAAALLLRHGGEGREEIRQGFMDYILEAGQGDKSTRAGAARLIGLAPPQPELREALSGFLDDEDPDVVRSALESAAACKSLEDYPKLLDCLADRRFRPEARTALAAFGTPILGRLNQSFLDASTEGSYRHEIPRVMGLIGGTNAARLLLSGFERTEGRLRLALLRALDRIRQDQPELDFDQQRVTAIIKKELRRYYQGAVLLGAIPSGPSGGDAPSVAFLRRALSERVDRRLEAIFRLLTLIYPRNEILDSYHWIMSGRPDLRSNALEFLDTRIELSLRPTLLGAAEHRGAEELLNDARDFFEFEQLPYAATLRRLLQGADPWLQACACYVVAEGPLLGLEPALLELTVHPDPLVVETAQFARQRIAAAAGGEQQS
ncbi:MAG: Npt1/Npt2 family nucleotide transporter, partial [Acidobacteria bacterium]|nr:Npt1/Npt2 family nucleotide transporter [Acidobacteriota bacterium]